MNVGGQFAAVTALNLRSIPHRFGTSLVIVVGIAGVVAVLLSMLAMSTGFKKTMENSAREDRAIVLSQGTESEAGSNLSRTDALNIGGSPGLKKAPNGNSVVSAEKLVLARVKRKGNGVEASVTLRGVGPEAFALRPEMKLVSGRMFKPAVHELLVGKSALAQFEGVSIGSEIELRGGSWKVVGIFTSDGNSHESELIADADTVLSAYAQNSFNSISVLLDSADSFPAFKDALTSNPALTVDVVREPEYFEKVSRPFNRVLNFVAYTIGGIMALGAMFGALNTMYSAVSARTTEIATLRAIGFSGGAVVVSVLVEALLLAVMGAVLGVLIAYYAFNGQALSTVGNAGGRSQLVYSLTVTGELMNIGIGLACFIGLVGGVFPAMHAARSSVAAALRAT